VRINERKTLLSELKKIQATLTIGIGNLDGGTAARLLCRALGIIALLLEE
jgi:hypothetical protein